MRKQRKIGHVMADFSLISANIRGCIIGSPRSVATRAYWRLPHPIASLSCFAQGQALCGILLAVELAVFLGDVAVSPTGDCCFHLEQTGRFFRAKTVGAFDFYRACFDRNGFPGFALFSFLVYEFAHRFSLFWSGARVWPVVCGCVRLL